MQQFLINIKKYIFLPRGKYSNALYLKDYFFA